VDKHRLELFSDGVFAIVLTLLVLDLKVPVAFGLAGVRDIAPALIVHALTFALVGVAWIAHHLALATVTEVSSRTLHRNLLALFWITLIPFGAKLAAARPLEALGPSALSATYGLYMLSALSIAGSATSTLAADPLMQKWRRNRIRLTYARAAFTLAGAALAWLWPLAGYLPLAAAIIYNLTVESAAEARQRIHRGQEAVEPQKP
jgi:uncharacterized membrane protein